MNKKFNHNKKKTTPEGSLHSAKERVSRFTEQGSFSISEVHMDEVERMLHEYVFPCVFLTLAIGFFLIVGCSLARGEEIDMTKIAMIESSGNPMAWNKKDDSRGLFQITKICLEEWNTFHPNQQFSMDDLWYPQVNRLIADWYINVRIPKMIKYYGAEDTIENRLIAYNAGISYLVNGKEIPKITKNYIKKYRGAL